MKKSGMNRIPYIIFGLITFIYGLGMFYVLPLSLLSMKISLILGVFLFILMGLIFGLTLLAMNLQRLVEIALTYILLFWEQPSMKRMVLNNLSTHQMRNKLTSAIFSMTLAFNIFIMVQFRLIIMQQKEGSLSRRGSFPYIETNDGSALNPFSMDPILDKYRYKIDSFSYVPFVSDRITKK